MNWLQTCMTLTSSAHNTRHHLCRAARDMCHCVQHALVQTSVATIELCLTAGSRPGPLQTCTNAAGTIPCCIVTVRDDQNLVMHWQPEYQKKSAGACTCRPVDCDTKQPFAAYLPGFVNSTIVSDKVETGWGVSSYSTPYGGVDQQLQQKYAGANATCFTLPSKARFCTLCCIKITMVSGSTECIASGSALYVYFELEYHSGP